MVWSYCLKRGTLRWIGGKKEYLRPWEANFKKGTILEMIMEGGKMSFYINSRPLGVAFVDD
jgi:hypothetical protein